MTEVVGTTGHIAWGPKLVAAMGLALEQLAATHPAWLRANSLPHWMERYLPPAKRPPGSFFRPDAEELGSLRSDIAHLLDAIAGSDLPDLSCSPEIQTLQKLSEAFESAGDG